MGDEGIILVAKVRVMEEYVAEGQYETYFERLGGLRSTLARDLPASSGMIVLDVATGYGYYAIEVAGLDPGIAVVGIDIARSDIEHSIANHTRAGLTGRVWAIQMDAARQGFRCRAFDMAVNFLGFEDIHMTRGRAGLERTFCEVNRVLKPGGHFSLAVMPPEEMETEAQETEVALFSYVCDSTWLSLREYEAMLGAAGFEVVRESRLLTGKKLTPEQARSEIRFACENVPKIYGKATPCFDDVWARFGPVIETCGLGHYSKLVSLLARKVNECG